MTGQVVALVPGAKQVRIAHDEVPGYMEKMTMPFAVRDLAELEGLALGDLVEVRLHVTATEERIDQVRKTGHRALAKELTLMRRRRPSTCSIGRRRRRAAVHVAGRRAIHPREPARQGRGGDVHLHAARCPTTAR